MRTQQLSENWRFFAVESPQLTAPEGAAVPVPGSWRRLPQLADYRGPGLYQNRFFWQPAAGETRAFLRFGSVFRRAEGRLPLPRKNL